MTSLRCEVCGRRIDKCRCADADERLREAAYDPDGHVLFKWCRVCDKHFARCKCRQPDFYIISGGEEVDPSNLVNLLGERVEVDLTRK